MLYCHVVPGILARQLEVVSADQTCTKLQGSDCVAPFKAMQQCMVKHPQAFAEYVQAKDADNEQKASAIGLLRSDQ